MPETYFLNNKKIWVAGHNGLVGSALCRRLEREDCEILRVPKAALDLRNQAAVQDWMAVHKPDAIILAAAKVGGIGANINSPAEFLYDNLMIEANIIHSAYESGVEKLLFLGSSCIYPKEAINPIAEDALLSGALETTNAPYALAKITGIKLCEAYRAQYGCNFISAMPCNLYGPHDNFDAETAHVIPALIARMIEAKNRGDSDFVVWGSGKPRREFLHVDDAADALILLLREYSGADPVNIGAGVDIQIAVLARKIADTMGYDGRLVFNTDKPDGVMQKCLNIDKISQMGWAPAISLEEGLRKTVRWFLEQY